MKINTVLIIICFFLNASIFASEGKFITDSLVQNLDCSKLSRDDVFSKVRDDAFSTKEHIGIPNWTIGPMGNCWSLSRVQRLFFYFRAKPGN